MFDDFERYARVPDEYAAPEVKEYAPTVSGLLRWCVAHCVWCYTCRAKCTRADLHHPLLPGTGVGRWTVGMWGGGVADSRHA